ncbi:MAG: serine/threonine protein kinase [Bryobacteraceae bacterium]|nr:serine/threonine protein kinase [Bryobacteraceae bacterium]
MSHIFCGRYEIFEEIGRGGMGTVHRARDTVLDRDVAIKVMRTGPRVDEEIRNRFYREARLGARLQHPNIVTVYDLGECDETAYIAMELLEGLDWRLVIKEKRRLPATKKIELIAQTCQGLSHAHRHSIIHRDLKPSNLYIHGGDQAKILDFGLARMPTSNLTLTGKILGTPNYMAPEQILGRRCDARSDLFSASIVFFEFLTGAHPFAGPFVPRRIVDGEPELLVNVDPMLPDSLGAIFEKALSKPPDSRYQDGAELANDLLEAAKEVIDEEVAVDEPAPFAGPGSQERAQGGPAPSPSQQIPLSPEAAESETLTTVDAEREMGLREGRD